MLSAKADALDRNIRKLGAVRDALRHAAVCPAPSHMECPTFRRYLRAATTKPASARTKPVKPPGSRFRP
jgi:hypothetical protein